MKRYFYLLCSWQPYILCLRFDVSEVWCVWGLMCLGFDVSWVWRVWGCEWHLTRACYDLLDDKKDTTEKLQKLIVTSSEGFWKKNFRVKKFPLRRIFTSQTLGSNFLSFDDFKNQLESSILLGILVIFKDWPKMTF